MKQAVDVIMLLDNPLRSDARVEKEAASLVAEGLRVQIWATSEDPSLPEEEMREGFQILRRLNPDLKRPLKRGYKHLIMSAVEQISRTDFRILHCHDFYLLPLAAAIKTSRKNIFLTYDSHEYLAGWPLWKEAKGLTLKVKGYLVWKRLLKLEAKYFKACNALITPSTAISKKMTARFKSDLHGIAVRNIPILKSDKEFNLRAALNIKDDVKLMVHSGNIYLRDDQLDLIFDAARQIPNFRIVFFGNRSRHLELKERMKRENRSHVLIHDYDADILLSAIAQCQYGLALTNTFYEAHYLGCSNRVMEYSLAGIPILATQQVTHQELQEQFGHLVLLKEINEQTIREGLETILSNEAELSHKASLVKDKLSWKREFWPVLRLYESLLTN